MSVGDRRRDDRRVDGLRTVRVKVVEGKLSGDLSVGEDRGYFIEVGGEDFARARRAYAAQGVRAVYGIDD